MPEQENRITNPRIQIRNLQEQHHNLTQSRDYWKQKADRVEKKLRETLERERFSKISAIKEMGIRIKSRFVVRDGIYFGAIGAGTVDEIIEELTEEWNNGK